MIETFENLERQTTRVQERLLKNARRCLIEMTRDAACRTIEGLEGAQAWEQLSKFCCDAGDEVVLLANGFLEPSLRPNWVATKLKSYEVGILEANTEDLCLILSIREDRQIGEDFTRKILEDKIHEAIDKAGVYANVKLVVATHAPESSMPLTGALRAGRHRKQLSRFDKYAGRLFAIAPSDSKGHVHGEDLLEIANKIDAQKFEPLRYLEHRGREIVANYNRQNPKAALTTWHKLASNDRFSRFVRRRLYKAKEKYQKSLSAK